MHSLLASFLDEEQATLICLLLSSIPLSFSLSIIKNKYLKLAISIICSVIFQCIIFPTQKYILWAQQQIVYVLLRFGPRKNIGKIILIESFLYLSVVQIRRMYIAYALNDIDITGILMMQIFLYVGLAYNYQNGIVAQEKLTEGAIKRRVVTLPDYLTYLGFVFFLPASLVGPVFQFKDFDNFINNKEDYQKLPSTIPAILNQLKTFIICLAIYGSTMSFGLWHTIKPQFAEHNYLYKLIYIGGAIFHIEFKYITAWSLGMMSVHASGLSYCKKDNNFQKVQVTKVYDFFFSPSLKVKVQCWNMSVQTALKRYIYEQVFDQKKVYQSDKARKKVQGKAQRNTLMTSALWHGLYPGYFISFFHWMIYLRISQELFRLRKHNKIIENLWTKYKFVHIQNLIGNYVLLYFGIFFHLMTWQNIKSVLASTYCIPFFILYGVYFAVYEAELLSRPKSKGVECSSFSSSEESSPQRIPSKIQIKGNKIS